MFSFLIIEGEIWLLDKLIKKYNSHTEAMAVMNDPVKKKEIEKLANAMFA